MATLYAYDVSLVYDYTAVALGNRLQPILTYLAGEVQTALGHSRVYDHHRQARDEFTFRALYTDGSGIEWWRVFRVNSPEQHKVSGLAERRHAITIEVTMVWNDGAGADSAMQVALESIADTLRGNIRLGGTCRRAWPGTTNSTPGQFAGVACILGQVNLTAEELLDA